MKSFSLVLNFSAALLFIGCAPTSSLQPDEVLLNHSTNTLGTSPTSIQEIARAPETNAFRVQDTQHLEELIESAQVSRAESREAVFVGETELPLLNGPFSDALPSGLVVQPRDNIQVFWPLDIINGYVKVKNSRDSISWFKYKNDLNQVQVVLLENFIIPQVSILDSRLITISQQTNPSENIEAEAVAVSTEESKEIPQVIEEDPHVEITEAEDTPQTLPEENIPPNNIELDTPAEIISEELPTKEEDLIVDNTDIKPDVEDTATSLAPLTSPRPKPRPDNLVTDDAENTDGSSLAPMTSPRPQARPEHLVVTPQAPLITAAGLSARELLESLGITEAPISNEARYLQEGERKISEVFHRGHKNFSACTFNPAQGSRKNRCYKELVLSEEFADFLEQKGQMCAESAAQEVFEKSPLKVLLKTNGGSVNRPSTTSLHSRGRALDVFKVSLYFEQGADPREVPFHRNQVDGQSVTERQNYNFYWSFHNCWKEEIKDYHQTKACGSSGRGALTYSYNSDHIDHMHISLPVCRDLRKRFGLNST